ncbi:TrmB family transcriptional regulator [Candidatus Woesearchaeota archaeon]|nr:TrmB family transcriptional regulator [Candidatus Woesearchaeota archaeon]
MIEKLKKFGLTEYEAMVYSTLLKEGELPGGKLSKLSRVPHGKTYQALETLEDKGFVTVLPLNPKIFQPVNPEIALNNFTNFKLNEYSRLKVELTEELKRIKKTKIEKKIIEKISVVAGKKYTEPLRDHLLSSAKKYIKYIFTYDDMPYSMIRITNEALKKGVKIMFIATKRENIKLIKEDIRRGIQVRYYPVESLRIVISDGKLARISIVNPRNTKDRISIYADNADFAKMLDEYFDMLWKKSRSL